MLTEREVRETAARRVWAVAPTMIGAVGAMFLYLAGMGHFGEALTSVAVDRLGGAAGEVAQIAMIVPAFGIFLLPTLLSAKYAERFKTVCPSCQTDVSRGTRRVLATRHCPACGERVLDGGRAHSDAVFQRAQARGSRGFLRHWLWAWPALGALAITWHWFDPSAFQRCAQQLWIAPLIGTATAGWTWLRTRDPQCIPQLLASGGMLGIGAAVFWRSL